MPDQILLDIINEHLPYEIDMLRGLFRQFGKVNRELSELDQKIQYYAQINSFCVHARALLDFFSNKGGDPTDATARDFTTAYTSPFDPAKEPLKSLRTKLNKQVFHLTKNRTIVLANKFDPGVDGAVVLQTIEPAIAHFIACLNHDFKHFKCGSTPIAFISTPGKASATGTIYSTNLSIPPE
jgi:hypothetical protein